MTTPNETTNSEPVPGSFRDPAGFLFLTGGVLHRQVNSVYAGDYDRLLASGLYDQLVAQGLLVPHEEVDPKLSPDGSAYRVLRPELVPFVSYPYEWSFSQLKDAALTTLRIQKAALAKGMTLKDASAFNIQFRRGRPVLIDTLSFTALRDGEPWVAYRQFCQHFLAPLALMAYRDVHLGMLSRTNLDGVPLSLASKLLPWHTRLVPAMFMHLHAHAAAQKRHAGDGAAMASGRRAPRHRPVSARALRGIIDNLDGAVRRLEWRPGGTEWARYYEDTNYSTPAMAYKRSLVEEFLARLAPASVWDLGANNGAFSRIASDKGIFTVAFDIDPAAVEFNYRECHRLREEHILPLVMDLTNPSPALGWSHNERLSFLQRGPADTVLALALIHHLAISNNVPLPRLAAFLAGAGRSLIVEFVPKSDSQVRRLLATREDVFACYDQDSFETAFRTHFTIEERRAIEGTERTLYAMVARDGLAAERASHRTS